MEAFELLLQGFLTLMTVQKLALMMVGLILGIFVGVLPGLGGPNGVAILLPLTFSMDPTSAIVMLSCLYWGALFGGAITSMLITFLAPRIADFALRFGPPEFFAVYLLTFCSFVGLGKEARQKIIISMALGLLL